MAVISQIKATSDNVNYNIRDDYSTWGGRNIMQSTNNPLYTSDPIAPSWNLQSGGNGVGSIETITDPPAAVANLTKTFRITGNTSGNKDFVQRFSSTAGTGPLCEYFGETFQFSGWVRGIGGNATALIRSWNSTKGNAAYQKTFSVTTDWQYFCLDYVTTANSAESTNLLDWRFGLTGAGSIEYIGMKLELGTKVTDWSPAPEDIARFIGDETIELYSE